MTGRASVSRPGVPESGRFIVSFTANGTRQDVLLSANGVFDRGRHRYALEVDGMVLAHRGDLPRRTVSVDGVVYMDFPDLARRLGVTTPWMSARTGGDDVLGLSAFDPTRVLDTLGAADAAVERGPDGLVRRVTMRFDAPGEDGIVLTVAYSDLGAPVTIEPPPADQVTDETEALTHRRGPRTGG